MEDKGKFDEIDGKKKDDLPPGYEEYLLLLQQRNRLLKKLKAKDKKQKELEKREQGFSLYLNGANVDLNLRKAENKSSRKARTADVENGARSAYTDESTGDERAWTAPSKHARKGWGKSPTQIKIKTEHGEKMELKTGKVTGKYSEDFEAYQSFLEEQLADEDDDNEENSDEEDAEGDEQETGSQEIDDTGSSDVSEDKEDRLTLTINDVKALRRSLEANKEIAESIRSIQQSMNEDDTDVEEDIEEQLDTLKNSKDVDPSSLPQLGQKLPEDKETEVITVSASHSGTEDKSQKSREFPEAEIIETDDKPKEMIFAPRKSRPLSANRRQRREDCLSMDESSEDIVSAIQAENRNVDVTKSSKSSAARESKSAPSKESKIKNEGDSVQRPSSIATTSVDNAMIAEIVERVKGLNGRQQIHLLKMLTKMEELDVTEDEISFGTMFFEKNSQRFLSDGGKVEPMLGQSTEENVDGNTSAEHRSSDNSRDQEDGTNFSQTIAVCLEIISNWGHADIVGLTEVDFFDKEEKIMRLNAENLEIVTDHICYGPVHSLINGKTKTTKERHMWKCQLIDAEPVKIVFHIPKDLSLTNEHGISKIAIWNYNKSLYDLNAGVKEARILIDREIIWEGIIDKGCGNQVFDYSKVISLQEEDASVTSVSNVSQINEERCKTAILERDSSELTNLPKIESPHKDPSINQDISSDSKTEEDHAVYHRPTPPSAKTEHPVRPSPMIRRYTPEVTDSTDIKRNSNLTDAGCVSEKADSLSSEKPIWLPGEADLKSECNLDSDNAIAPLPVSRSRPSSGRRAEAKISDNVDNSMSRRTASAGRRKGQHVKNDDKLIDDAIRDESDGLEESSKKKTPSSGRRSRVDDRQGTTEKGVQENSHRKKYREIIDDELEQSLNSINIFEHSHLGRITSDLDLEKDQGDALDLLVKPLMGTNEATPNKSDMSEQWPEASDVGANFEIPTLPKGRTLVLNLKSTWGDKHYIGLNGIEVFTDKGELAKISEISANPADINVLPEYNHDPRVVTNLVDGVYMTRDDLHLWLTPFTPGANHSVTLYFDEPVAIAMIRIWNYNKSRIHSTRGVRYIEISLGEILIFKGEIARASGILSKESDPYGDIILFTTDEDILEEVAKHDFTYEYDIFEEEEQQLMHSVEQNRPITADKEDLTEFLERPYTCPKSRSNPSTRFITQEESYQAKVHQSSQPNYIGKVVRMNFTQTWGDEYYLGLTGIEILGENFEPIPIDFEWMDACPRDLNDLDDYDDDDRTLDKLIDGENVTNSDEHMWLVPFSEGEPHIITVTFPERKLVTGIRVWNYNKSTEDTYRGAKVMQLFIDDVEIFPEHGFLLRKGPGHCHFDFAQDLLFNQEDETHDKKDRAREASRVKEDIENFLLPTGFVFQIRLLSTWGDPYYAGLNGIEFYDEYGAKILLDENNVTAYPHSVNILEGIENDARTPDKLVDGINDTYDASHMWLAPVFPGIVNVIYIVFDSPIALSMIKMWNYSKTGSRGVRQFSILVDDLLVYNGILPQVTHHTRAILPQIDIPIQHHTILFTDDEYICGIAPKNIISNVPSDVEQDVQMTNERSIVSPYANPNSAGKTVDPAHRPMTSVSNVRPRR